MRLRAFGLAAAVAVPILYYGTQLAALPFYAGYDPMTQPASALGSGNSNLPWLFNGGAILTGLASLAAAYGIAAACIALGGARWAAWLAALALLSCGLASLNAGWFALPDPRHNPGWLGIGTFLLPPLLLLAVWRIPGLERLRLFLAGAILAVAAVAPFMAGWTGLDRADYGGLLQRLLTLPLFLSVAMAGLGLAARLRQLDPQ